MTFPTMTSTWEFSRVGFTNVIPLVGGGGPYTVGMDKASAGYTAQLYWSPNLDASPQDDSWVTLTDLNSTDEVAVSIPGTARAIMGSITVRPAGADIAELGISVGTANALGAQNKRRHASGYGANLFGGAAPVQDEYAALVLADMGAVRGSFFQGQDGVATPLTDSGPDAVATLAGGIGAVEVEGPWEGSKAFNATAFAYSSDGATNFNFDVSEEGTMEVWFRSNAVSGANIRGVVMLGNTLGFELRIQTDRTLLLNLTGTQLGAQTGWAISTVYAVGDRVSHSSLPNNVLECETAGTSAASEFTLPAVGATVADNTVTWRYVTTSHAAFHNATVNENSPVSVGVAAVGEWVHWAFVRDSAGFHQYLNGVLDGQFLVPAIDTVPGTFGVPSRYAFASVSYSGLNFDYGLAGSNVPDMASAYLAHYASALTPAQILAHYNKGVELGLGSL
jgi:hypothetical protein